MAAFHHKETIDVNRDRLLDAVQQVENGAEFGTGSRLLLAQQGPGDVPRAVLGEDDGVTTSPKSLLTWVPSAPVRGDLEPPILARFNRALRVRARWERVADVLVLCKPGLRFGERRILVDEATAKEGFGEFRADWEA